MFYNSLISLVFLDHPVLSKSHFNTLTVITSMIPGPAALANDASPADPPSETIPAVPNVLTAPDLTQQTTRSALLGLIYKKAL
jgi:hypothetical protein